MADGVLPRRPLPRRHLKRYHRVFAPHSRLRARGRGLDFVRQVGKLTFGGVKGWHEGDHLALAAQRAGLQRRP